MSAALDLCMDDADFLAALGGLLLEDGDSARALVWLERALLLDPGNLGAQADHAIALAELGEPDALRELTRQWRGRTDLPPALHARLYAPDLGTLTALPGVKFGQPLRQAGPAWGIHAEASFLVGHENNLDRSPRISELTLSIPEGPLVLPVVSVPRKGSAGLGGALLQAAYSPWSSTVLRTSLNLNARRSPSERTTDWHQSQWSMEWLQRGNGWRTELDAAATWIGGPLGEPYRLERTAGSVEVSVAECTVRISRIAERRVQAVTTNLDARSSFWGGGLLCPVPATSTWTMAVNVNSGIDDPVFADRPGDRQRLRASIVRLLGTVGTDTVVDLSLRNTDVHDAEGYSPLLENNAIRTIGLRQVSLEVSQPLTRLGWTGLNALLQVQSARQRSNLALFAYRSDSVYAGVRWTW